jgi:hypothetical protein
MLLRNLTTEAEEREIKVLKKKKLYYKTSWRASSLVPAKRKTLRELAHRSSSNP